MRQLIGLPALALSLCAPLLAGPITPPAGPVAPTPGPEPRTAINATNTPGDANNLFKITQPGSYYLTENIIGAVGLAGIGIGASGVNIDLNGFDLLGVAGSSDGIRLTVLNPKNIVICNGSVRSWGGDGIDLSLNSPTTCRIDRVLAYGNTLSGFRVAQEVSITECSASNNGQNGFEMVTACSIERCTAYNNDGNGFSAGASCRLINCTAYSNGTGITVGAGSIVIDCLTRASTTDGIVCTSNCLIRSNNCSLDGNGGVGAGVHVLSGKNRIESNNCSDADTGIMVDGSGNIIIGNTCSNNTNNWMVAANNKCLVTQGVNALAISGDSGGVSPGSTNPFANFSY